MNDLPQWRNNLFGRQEVCALAQKRLEAFRQGYRQNVAMLGPHRSGKSTFVRAFYEYARTEDVIPILFTCNERESFEYFADRWMSEILTSFYRSFHGTKPYQFQELIQALWPLVPKTIRQMKRVKKSIMKRRFDHGFRELLGLTATLQEECGRKILLILDDFNYIGDLKVNDPFFILGQEIMLQKDTMYFVASSRMMESRAIVRDKLSLLFGNFEILNYETLDFKSAREFLDLNLFPNELHDTLTRFLIRLTNGHPYYLKIMCRELRDLKREEFLSDEEWVVEMLMRELSMPCGTLHQFFRSELFRIGEAKTWTMCADLLAAISKGHKRFNEIARFLHQTTNDVKKTLQRLLQTEMIQKHGAVFSITDPLFRFWLNKVFYRFRFGLGASEFGEQEWFRNEVRREVLNDAKSDELDLPEKIEDLFRNFKNETVELNERKLLCPQFTEIVCRPFDGRTIPIVARNAKVRWMCQVVSSMVMEEDIQNFLSDLKRLRSPVNKRIIVGLAGIDLNAKLLAQEANIQYLDLNQFNSLLDIYDKPKLVV